VIPLTIINGTRSGPTLLLEAGIHGTEYPGIRATQILAQEIKPNQLEGTLIIIHCANVPMFNAKTAFVNPIDDINFNRIFPGQPKSTIYYGPGTISHHITNYIFENIMKKATHFIDLHGGDLPELCPCFAISTRTGDDDKDVDTAAMLRYSLADFATLRPPNQAPTTLGTMSQTQIPNMLIESGGGGILTRENTRRHVDAVVNVMKYLKMLGGEPEEPKNQTLLTGMTIGVRAERGGFFTYLVGVGDLVEEGQPIGEITDPFGGVIEEIEAPMRGVVHIINFLSAKNTGDPLFSIAEPC
jgi:predicted deacylase